MDTIKSIGEFTGNLAKDHPIATGIAVTFIGAIFSLNKIKDIFSPSGIKVEQNVNVTVRNDTNDNPKGTIKTNTDKEINRKRMKKLREIASLNEEIKELKNENEGQNTFQIKNYQKRLNILVVQFKAMFNEDPMKYIQK